MLNSVQIYDRITVNGQVCIVVPLELVELAHRRQVESTNKLRAALRLPPLLTGKRKRKTQNK